MNSPEIIDTTTSNNIPKVNTYSFSFIFGELLFTVMPFAILFLVFLYQEKPIMFYVLAPEWAFAAAILFGQTLVKIVQGSIVVAKKSNIAVERIGLIVATIIVLGLVPSMVILALTLVSPEQHLWLGIAQIILFVLSSFVFVIFGVIMHKSSMLVQTNSIK